MIPGLCSVGCVVHASLGVIEGAHLPPGCTLHDTAAGTFFVLGSCDWGPARDSTRGGMHAHDQEQTGADGAADGARAGAAACAGVSAEVLMRHVMAVPHDDASGGRGYREAFQQTGVCAQHLAWAHLLRRHTESASVVSSMCGGHGGGSREPLCLPESLLSRVVRSASENVTHAIGGAFAVRTSAGLHAPFVQLHTFLPCGCCGWCVGVRDVGAWRQEDELLRAIAIAADAGPATYIGEFGDVMIGALGVPLGDGCDDVVDTISGVAGTTAATWLPALLSSAVRARLREIVAVVPVCTVETHGTGASRDASSGSGGVFGSPVVARTSVVAEVVSVAPIGCPVPVVLFTMTPVSFRLHLLLVDATSGLAEVETYVHVYRGVGSFSFVAHSAGRKVVLVAAGDSAARDTLARAVPLLSTSQDPAFWGTWGGAPVVAWKVVDVLDDSASVLRLDGLTVVAGDEGVIAPGAVLVLSSGGSIVVEVGASLVARGTSVAPILVTSPAGSPWAEICVRGFVILEHVWLVNGGGGADMRGRVFGHSGSAPVIRFGFVTPPPPVSTLVGGGIVDCPGKAIGALRARVMLDSVTIARVDTGGEIVDSCFSVRQLHVSEIPSARAVVSGAQGGALALLIHCLLWPDAEMDRSALLKTTTMACMCKASLKAANLQL